MPSDLVGWAVALLAAMAYFVVKAEYPDWGRRASGLLMRWAAWCLPEPDRSISREEWDAELVAVREDTDRSCTGLTYAGWLALRHSWRVPLRVATAVAWRFRRRARIRVRRLQVGGGDIIQIENVGRVAVTQVKIPIGGLLADDWQDGDAVP